MAKDKISTYLCPDDYRKYLEGLSISEMYQQMIMGGWDSIPTEPKIGVWSTRTLDKYYRDPTEKLRFGTYLNWEFGLVMLIDPGYIVWAVDSGALGCPAEVYAMARNMRWEQEKIARPMYRDGIVSLDNQYYRELPAEKDEQGTLYGYKMLYWCPSAKRLKSPQRSYCWDNGEGHAHVVPSAHSMYGIHCVKVPYHPVLSEYLTHDKHNFLVRLALSGTVVETEQGFRAEHAQIVGVWKNGNWQNYQDPYGCP